MTTLFEYAAAQRRHLIAGLILAAAALSQTASATTTDTAKLPPAGPAETATCEAGLQFGITTDKIPLECHARLVAVKTTDDEVKEKWEYQNGFLFFSHGVLKAVRQVNN
jgi:hypothetical protein